MAPSGTVRTSLLTLVLLAGAWPAPGTLCAAEVRQVDIHDPAMAKEGESYYLYSSGPGIPFYSSKDMRTWRLEGRVFPGDPSWARGVAGRFNGHVWAPDIVRHNDRFHLYYSVSSWGQNSSAIGLTLNKTLHPESPDYRWEDQGIVVQSVPNRDLWNAIDSTIVVDEKGAAWMGLGSFWGGLKLFRLDETWKRPAQPQEWYSIAKRERSVLIDDKTPGPGQIEGPFLFKKGEYTYLFVSWGLAAQGRKSTYRMMVGRSKDVRGPYLDKEGKDMAKGGGSPVLIGNNKWVGWGGNSAYTFDGKDYLVFHAYENADNDFHRLKVAEIQWDADRWPGIDEKALDEYIGVQLN
ncbi:MAG: family 43 glycosylhydrolase [Phycisphaerae bacterium]|nr:family 43 glycosylhydrolase [Phycisphaerae bacterium]